MKRFSFRMLPPLSELTSETLSLTFAPCKAGWKSNR